MNFLAHAHVARHHRDEPAFVLGSMLPDLVPMFGIALRRDEVPAAVADGWRFHHVVDEAFHAAPAFHLGVRALRDDLRVTSLHTGARRAVAHVGWELLLDDVVAADPAAMVAFEAALAVAPAELGTEVARKLAFRVPRTVPGVGVRVHRAVSRRARLAFDESLVPEVEAVLERHRAAVAAAAPAVLAIRSYE